MKAGRIRGQLKKSCAAGCAARKPLVEKGGAAGRAVGRAAGTHKSMMDQDLVVSGSVKPLFCIQGIRIAEKKAKSGQEKRMEKA